MAVSFDLFGTLVSADTPDDPAAAVADALADRGVDVPDDWSDAYREPHVDAPEGAEVPLHAHVARALASRGVHPSGNVPRRAVVSAFDPAVETRDGAREALEAAREHGPVALCSNCSVPELVGRTLVRSDFSRDDFDAVVSSVACGWRKPSPEIFEQTADELGVAPEELIHVGDDPRTDGGIEGVGGRAIVLEETPLAAVPDRLAELLEDDSSGGAG
ncbi:haloacid dehalogenase superfamily, subfamily IA, variant 3 with third motif having DD or ED/haloacid dehalogenase superfamily, subfamily IA, variant 1 with third motif having Dx(3-4)D or Dx(3-4)E [Halobiforma haloterrestris]|uniref:Haloacid dehalogenase superfamily, subfamily IA, variant 3 with third motif having DD or ED/haloacid dehalogenase superfamily, subfamily IA, variant 1 with third motif having Dx(3-4)D or Dx(3-4)E n=1 Tax=Natronobacterium haloterrestre TaxID=148448 RepID=A0A1I1EJS7_NATHA|nr:HAD family hydrolase [Halobiforma haloterrestris]SFB87409.1 haloacid dehalogenase superfamily, subfamily IA, variant 3 with third motif having DD or ED/haloacid dehalogenase superfamily, subfamily IA, variant 1 with third motif having Dx(3-4)D or Dx(3-4)E [Halobiforma haloterrestris]